VGGRACTPWRCARTTRTCEHTRVNLLDKHVRARTHTRAYTCARTRHIFTCTSERALAACERELVGRRTGDVILTKGRNNIDVDLLKNRLFLARVPSYALPFWYFESLRSRGSRGDSSISAARRRGSDKRSRDSDSWSDARRLCAPVLHLSLSPKSTEQPAIVARHWLPPFPSRLAPLIRAGN